MTKEITLEQFRAFARTKSGPFEYASPWHCAMAQFAEEVLGLKKPFAVPGFVYGEAPTGAARYNMVEIPERVLQLGSWERVAEALQ